MKHEHSQDRSRPTQAGFTLVEIMVVIVILGLLATLVAKNVLTASDEAREGTAKTNCVMISKAVAEYYAKNGQVPDTLEILWEKDEKGRSLLDPVGDDPWGNPYVLRSGDRPSDYEVISCGKDGSEGTEDDISSALQRKDR